MWMHAVALGLAALSVDPAPMVAPHTVNGESIDGTLGGRGHVLPFEGPLYGSANIPVGPAARNPGLLAHYPYSCSCRKQFGYDRWGRPVWFPIIEHWCDSSCDMPMHQAYILLHPDNYYFRPYSLMHVNEQRQAVLAWGGDPRHPYANEIFQRVYAEWEADQTGEGISAPSNSVVPEEAPAPLEAPQPGSTPERNGYTPPLPPNLQINPVSPPAGTP